jgi:hypothetical protein
MKKNEKDEDIIMHNLREDLSYAQSDLNNITTSIDKILKVINTKKMDEDLEKVRK